MRNVFMITPEQFDIVLRMERLLLSLPKEGGILFVGASFEEEEPQILSVTIGCTRDLKTDTVMALFWNVVAKDPELSTYKNPIKVSVYRGVARSS